MNQTFDVVVIGGGPGGYTAAIRAAQLGMNVACIDDWRNAKGGAAPGGTCTNVGCIPSKALLQSSEHFEQAQQDFAKHGISLGAVKMDPDQMIKRKDDIVKQNNDGILYLLKKNKVSFFHGHGSFERAVDQGYEIKVSGEKDGLITGQQIIVATGSSARALPGVPFDEKQILSNDGALALQAVPKKLGVIGAGVIGLELGSVWRRLGAEVVILEGLPDFLGQVDAQISKEAKKLFVRQGLKIELGVRVTAVKAGKKGVSVSYEDAKGKSHKLAVDQLIVSIGRVPNTDGLGVDKVGLELGERGDVAVDDDCRTNLPGVWAVGDVVRGPMLAHKADEEGVAVAERIAGQTAQVDFNLVPSVIYTSPEIAWIGRSEQALKEAGTKYRSGVFPFLANGRARALGDTTGMVKMLADAETDEILGVHAIGPMVSELIAEACVAMAFRASSEDVARICHAHPTLSEATKEAALAVDKRTINF